MKEGNEYGNGRLSVIRELERFMEKEKAKIKGRGNPKLMSIQTRCTLSGVLSGYNQIRLQLEKKKEAILKHE